MSGAGFRRRSWSSTGQKDTISYGRGFQGHGTSDGGGAGRRNRKSNQVGKEFRVIIPCGPSCWYADWVRLVNERQVSLKHVTVFHMDECLDWEGKLLPKNHPYNFRTFMEEHFYGGIPEELNVPVERRFFLSPETMDRVKEESESSHRLYIGRLGTGWSYRLQPGKTYALYEGDAGNAA